MSECLSLHGRWQVMPGAAYGVHQPTVTGVMAVAPGAVRFDLLDAALQRLFEGRLRPAAAASEDPQAALVDRWLRAYHALLDGLRVPVFEEAIRWRMATPPDGAAAAFLVALPYLDRATGQQSIRTLVTVFNALVAEAVAEPAQALSDQVAQVRKGLRAAAPEGINIGHLLRAAHALGVPTCNCILDIYQFGHGRHARLLRSTLTDATPALASSLARSKASTCQMLGRLGLPVPRHRVARTEAEALQAAQDLGYPVVVKPDDQEQGRGVCADIRQPALLATAWQEASQLSRHVLVEEHVYGEDIRVTVLLGEAIKVIRRRAGGVTGDGASTIAQQVQVLRNSAATLSRMNDQGFRPVELDAEALGILEDRGLAPDTVLAAGQFVPLRRRGNVSAGGSQEVLDVARLHPDNIELAVRAAAALRLDIAGIDLMLEDSTRSWLETRAVILEVNAMPQVSAVNTPQVYQHMLQRLVPGGGRIPLHLVLAQSAPTDADVPGLLARHGATSLSASDGLWFGGRRVAPPFRNGFAAARAMLADSRTESGVMVLEPQEVVESGLPSPWVDSISTFPAGLAEGAQGTLALALRLARPHARREQPS